jgi:hypothetical protein
MLSSISSAGAGYESASSVQSRSQAVDQLFKKADSNSDGKITKQELTQALEPDQKSNADEILKMLGSGNKGYITKQDATDALAKLDAAGTDSKTGGSAGPPGGGGGAAPAATDTDPADTNQDGKVSMAEEAAYALKQYAADSSTQQSQIAVFA